MMVSGQRKKVGHVAEPRVGNGNKGDAFNNGRKKRGGADGGGIQQTTLSDAAIFIIKSGGIEAAKAAIAEIEMQLG